MSGFTPKWCPASSVTVSGMERNAVRLAVEWVSGFDRNTHSNELRGNQFSVDTISVHKFLVSPCFGDPASI